MTDLGIDLDAEVWKQGIVSSQMGSPVLWHRYQRLEASPRVRRVRDCAVFLHVCMCTCMHPQTHCETIENKTASYSFYIPAPTAVPGNSKCSLSAFEVENVEQSQVRWADLHRHRCRCQSNSMTWLWRMSQESERIEAVQAAAGQKSWQLVRQLQLDLATRNSQF